MSSPHKSLLKIWIKYRFKFPKFPSIKTIIAISAKLKYKNLNPEKQHKKIEELQTLLKKVKVVLKNEEVMKELKQIRKNVIEKCKKRK